MRIMIERTVLIFSTPVASKMVSLRLLVQVRQPDSVLAKVQECRSAKELGWYI